MLLLLLILLQQARVSRFVIIAAVLLFIAVVSRLVYFYRRYQRVEKNPEDDWDQSRSLFVSAPAPRKVEDSGTAIVTPAPAIESAGTRELASPVNQEPPAARIEPPPVVVAAQPLEQPPAFKPEPAPPVEAQARDRMTQVLASPPQVEPKSEPEKEQDREHAAFDEDVWAGLELEGSSSTEEQGRETNQLHAIKEAVPSARVDERSHREPFESPRIERVTHREAYEPPSIEPLTPREQEAAKRDLRTAPPATLATSSKPDERGSRDTIIFGTKSSERDKQPLATEPVIASSGRIAEPSVAGARSYRTPAGSVLGIPAEPSQVPLILGEPVRPESEAGIGALTNYGKDLSPKSGRGGTVTLLIVIALLGGSALVYLFVPSVHGRVNAFVARVRGVDKQVSNTPKAQIFPSYRPEVNKNMVTARGAIDNISDEPLENLEVEISLQRGGDSPPEVRRIPVTPSPIEPGARGAFQFEYDGKRDTGFVGYKITKLFSNGSEIKFRTPNQK